MTEDTMLNTTLQEPSTTAGEAELLLFALERSRAQFAWKCGGLDAVGLRQPHPTSTMTLAGLVKHLALVEYQYSPAEQMERPPGASENATPENVGPDWEWRSAIHDSPADLYGYWRRAVERSRAAWDEALADGGLDQPSKFVRDDGSAPNLRRVLVDLHDEYARHVGHADLLREAVDGLVGEDPPQA